MQKESLKLLIILASVVLIALVLLSVATYWFYQDQEHGIRDLAFAELQAIGELKANEITRWRAERLADANVLIEGRFLQEAVHSYYTTPTPDVAAFLLKRFNGIRRYYDYDELVVIDRNGRVLLSTSDRTTTSIPAEALDQAFISNEPVFTDIYETEDDLGPHLSLVSPIPSFPSLSDPPSCAIVLVCSASRYLYPMIQAWPTPSQTAETLLIRQEGDRVLYLNDLRHRPGSALSYSVSITAPTLSSTHAVQGFTGVVEGIDYRGVRVLAYVCSIPNTTWSMVAKQDWAEVFSVWRSRSRIILVLFGVLALGVIIAAVAILSRYHRQHYRALYRYENEIRQNLEKHRITLDAIGDAVIVTDCEGHIEFLNPAAEKMTGWSHVDANGKPLHDVFCVINEETREAVECPVQETLRGGGPAPLASHTLLIAKDGMERSIINLVSPIYDQSSEAIGVVFVFRDETMEQNYKLVFQKMRSGFASHAIICNPAGEPVDYRFIDVNPAFERMTGLRAKDIVGKTVLEVLPETEIEWIERYGRVALTGEPTHFENVAKNLKKMFSVSAYRTLPGHFATIFTDITESKRMEHALKNSENRYRSLTNDVLDNAEVGTFILDAQFKIVWVNQAMAHYFGFDREVVIGGDKRQLIHGQIARIFEDPQAFTDRVLATYDNNTYVEHFLCHILADEGREERWLQHSSQPITTGIFAGGRVEHYYDVTAIKRAEEQMVQKNDQLHRLNKELASAVASNDRLAAAIEQSQDPIVITDADANILYINQTFEQVTGYAREEVIGQNPRILQSGKHDPAFYEKMWSELKSGNPVFIQFINKRKDGVLYTEEASLSPVMDAAGMIVNYVGVKRDITERLKMEERLNQTQKMETVGRLAGGVAHDFNNMLGVILGNAELLQRNLTAGNPLHEEVTAIINAAKRSADITRQLLTFARKQVINPRILDVNEAVANCLKLLNRLIGENIELTWKPWRDPCYVKMDAVQIDQILTNLCINARDAINDSGTIAIETARVALSAKDCEPYPGCYPGDFIVISVLDTGAGMTADVLGHAFEPFFSEKTLGDGTGLGLATVDGIVSQNGGFIDVKSKVDTGTAFSIYLPAQTVPQVIAAASDEKKVPKGKGETVLLVEDEEMLLKLAATMLRSLDYHVLPAATPALAIQLAKEHTGALDLLLTDVVMSDMNGKELAGHICAIHPHIHVMFMSGYTADIIASHGVLETGVHFISKPFSRTDIAVKLREVLLADKPPARALERAPSAMRTEG